MILHCEHNSNIYTVGDYLIDCVTFPVTEAMVRTILVDRGVKDIMLYEEADKKLIELCKADLYKMIYLSPNRIGAVSDTDNGWTHSDGGYTLTDADKTRLLSAANAIYEKYGEETIVRKTTFKVISHGVKPANYDIEGNPIPFRVVK